MTACTFCGHPINDDGEEHHHNERRTDNDPDNLRTAHRRCHQQHHGNDTLADNRTAERYGPPSPSTGPR